MCVRHRESQTLYVSDIIHPPTCKAPAYGKLHIGIYIAAIQDAIRRMKLCESLPSDQRSKLPSSFAKFNKRGGDKGGRGDRKDGPADGDGGGGSSRGNTKRQKKDDGDPRGKGKGGGRKGKATPKPRRRTRGNLKSEREEQNVTFHFLRIIQLSDVILIRKPSWKLIDGTLSSSFSATEFIIRRTLQPFSVKLQQLFDQVRLPPLHRPQSQEKYTHQERTPRSSLRLK